MCLLRADYEERSHKPWTLWSAYSPAVLEFSHPRSRCWQAGISPEAYRCPSFLCLHMVLILSLFKSLVRIYDLVAS